MNNPYTSPELAPKRPEIKGGAALEAAQRVKTIEDAVRFVLQATEGVQLPVVEIEKPFFNTPAEDPGMDPRMDAALAAVEAAHRDANPETGFAQIGA